MPIVYYDIYPVTLQGKLYVNFQYFVDTKLHFGLLMYKDKIVFWVQRKTISKLIFNFC